MKQMSFLLVVILLTASLFASANAQTGSSTSIDYFHYHYSNCYQRYVRRADHFDRKRQRNHDRKIVSSFISLLVIPAPVTAPLAIGSAIGENIAETRSDNREDLKELFNLFISNRGNPPAEELDARNFLNMTVDEMEEIKSFDGPALASYFKNGLLSGEFCPGRKRTWSLGKILRKAGRRVPKKTDTGVVVQRHQINVSDEARNAESISGEEQAQSLTPNSTSILRK